MILKGFTYLFNKLELLFYNGCTWLLFKLHDVEFGKFESLGLPILEVREQSLLRLGNKFVMVNCAKHAVLGRNNKCKFVVYKNAKLIIGKNVAMSNCTIVATSSITLGDNIMIGGGVTIIDSDFHSLNPAHWHTDLDELNMKSKPVKIENNVFIGMDSKILKGVNIGSNSIIAAGSVLFSSVPENEVWGGNPAKFIRQNY